MSALRAASTEGSASPGAGSFTSAQSIKLTATKGTTYYTTNGTVPTTASAIYTAPIAVTTTETIKYFSVDAWGNTEAVDTAAYTISLPVTSISPAAGSYTSAQSVKLTTTKGLTHYTVDGTTPTTSSPVYTTAIAVAASETIKYFSMDAANNMETVKTAAYVITIPVAAAKK